MSEFKLVKTDTGFNKVDNNGKIVASVNYSDSDKNGKADKVKFGGNVSLFTAEEVANDLTARGFDATNKTLPKDEKGNFKIDPCKSYGAGSLANYLNGNKKTESNITGTKTTSSTPEKFDFDQAKMMTNGFTPSAVGTSIGADPGTNYAVLMDYFSHLIDTIPGSESIDANANKTSKSSVNGGFVLDPNASAIDGTCKADILDTEESTDVKPVVSQKPEIEAVDCDKNEKLAKLRDDLKKELADCEQGKGPCADTTGKVTTTETPVVTNTGAADTSDCKDLVMTDKTSYKVSNEKVGIDFKDRQWITKVAAGIYGEDAVADAGLRAALLNELGYTEESAKHISVGTKLDFPKVVEVNGKRYEAVNCTDKKDVTDPQLQDKADAEIPKYTDGSEGKGFRKPVLTGVTTPVKSEKPVDQAAAAKAKAEAEAAAAAKAKAAAKAQKLRDEAAALQLLIGDKEGQKDCSTASGFGLAYFKSIPGSAVCEVNNFLYKYHTSEQLDRLEMDKKKIKKLGDAGQDYVQKSSKTQKSVDVILEKTVNSPELKKLLSKLGTMSIEELAKPEYASQRQQLLVILAKDANNQTVSPELEKVFEAQILSIAKNKTIVGTAKNTALGTLKAEDMSKVMSMTSLDTLMNQNNNKLLGSLLDYVATSLENKDNAGVVNRVMDKLWNLALNKAANDPEKAVAFLNTLLGKYDVSYSVLKGKVQIEKK